MAERRKDGRVRKSFELPNSHAELLRKLASKYGLTEAGAICAAITKWADSEGLLAKDAEGK